MVKPKNICESHYSEVALLLRYACERYARASFEKANASRIRIAARKMERAASNELLRVMKTFKQE